MEIELRPLPSNPEAERSILGAVLLDNHALDAAAHLTGEDFLIPQNRRIFERMLALAENHEAIDTITLMESLAKRDELEAAGGLPYLSQLADGIPSVMNVAHYAKIVRDKFILRQLIHTAESFREAAFAARDNVEEVTDRAAFQILELAQLSAPKDSESKSYRDAASSFLMSIDGSAPQDVIPPVPTGVNALDKSTGGFRNDEVVTLTAGTGVGKTFLAQQIRDAACRVGLHGLYCSGEMTAEHLVSRELGTKAGVEHWKLRRPERLTSDELNRLIVAASGECDKCSILGGELSIRKIRTTARRKKKEPGLNLVVLDYDELIDAAGKNEIEQQRNVIRAAKSLGTELQCCVIVISQLRKSLDRDEAKKPTLERIYGSGAKSKHSSWIIFVDREYVRELKGDETEARICILKARDGRIGEIPATFNLQTLRFEDRVGLGEVPPPQGRGRRKKTQEDE